MSVEYRDVVGFLGYCVGSDGSLWKRWKRKSLGCGRGSRAFLSDIWTKCKLQSDKDGYLHGSVWRDGKNYKLKMHRVVLEAFIGPCPQGMEGRHFPDRSPTNNNLTNLSWANHKTNEADKDADGTRIQGQESHFAKLTEEQVLKIRKEHAEEKITMKALGTRYGVSAASVCVIVNRRTWRHI